MKELGVIVRVSQFKYDIFSESEFDSVNCKQVWFFVLRVENSVSQANVQYMHVVVGFAYSRVLIDFCRCYLDCGIQLNI